MRAGAGWEEKMKENRADVFAVLLTDLKTNRVKDCLSMCSFRRVLSCGQHPGASTEALLPKNFWMLLTGCVEFGLVLNRSLGFPGVAQWWKLHPPMQEMQEMQVQSLGREDSPGVENGNPLEYSCLENPMDRGAWSAVVHGLANSNTIEHIHTHTNRSLRLLFDFPGLSWMWMTRTTHRLVFSFVYTQPHSK